MAEFTVVSHTFEAANLEDALEQAIAKAQALADAGEIPAANCLSNAARNMLAIRFGRRTSTSPLRARNQVRTR